jgi:hypothetical protein
MECINCNLTIDDFTCKYCGFRLVPQTYYLPEKITRVNVENACSCNCQYFKMLPPRDDDLINKNRWCKLFVKKLRPNACEEITNACDECNARLSKMLPYQDLM